MLLAPSPSAFHLRKNGNRGILDCSPLLCVPEHLDKHSAQPHTCQRPSCSQELKIKAISFLSRQCLKTYSRASSSSSSSLFFSSWLSVLLTEYHITGIDCTRVTWIPVTMFNLPFTCMLWDIWSPSNTHPMIYRSGKSEHWGSKMQGFKWTEMKCFIYTGIAKQSSPCLWYTLFYLQPTVTLSHFICKLWA